MRVSSFSSSSSLPLLPLEKKKKIHKFLQTTKETTKTQTQTQTRDQSGNHTKQEIKTETTNT